MGIPVAPTAIKFLSSDKLGKQYKNDLFVAGANNGHIYHFDLNEGDRQNYYSMGPLQIEYPITLWKMKG